MATLHSFMANALRFAGGQRNNLDIRVKIDERGGVFGMNAFALELMQDGAHDAVTEALKKVVHPKALSKTPIDTREKADNIVLRTTVRPFAARRASRKPKETGIVQQLPAASGVVRAGWPMAGRLTNYAAKQELGAPGRNVPQLRFMRDAIYDQETEIVRTVYRVMGRYVRHYTPKEYRKWAKLKRSAPSK